MKRFILVIEDDADLLRLLKDRFEFFSFQCATAATAEEGLEMARRRTPDLILLDMMLPHMSGLGCLREIKRDPALSHVPVIILSALSDHYVILEGMDLGAAAYLCKTCDARELFAAVQAYIAGGIRDAIPMAVTSPS